MTNNGKDSMDPETALGNMPGWISRHGLWLLLIIFVALLSLCNMVKYPVTIKSTVAVPNNTEPHPIVSWSTGRIRFFGISSGQTVSAGQPLASIGGSADPDQVMRLRRDLLTLSELKNLEYLQNRLSSYTNLAELHHFYSDVLQALFDLQNFNNTVYHKRKITALQKQLETLHQLHQQQLSDHDVIWQLLKLRQQEFTSDSLLHARSLIPFAKYSQSQNAIIEVKRDFNLTLSNSLSTKLKIAQLEESIQDYQHQETFLKAKYTQALITQLKLLSAKLLQWENSHVIKAPIQGQLSLHDHWSAGMFVNKGDSIMTILPLSDNRMSGEMKVPIAEVSQMDLKGQQIRITFDKYPENEYGTVIGSIANVRKEPGADHWIAEISFHNRLKSSNGHELPFYPKMTGETRIKVNEISLLARAFTKTSSFLRTKGTN